MRARIQGLAAAGAFALYAAMGAAAFAQPTPGQPMGGMAGGPGPQHHMMTAHGEDPAEHVARLRDLLQLRPAQEPALQAFVTALKAAHQGMMGPPPGGPMPSTTPERLDRMQQMMAQHQKTMSAVSDATRRFYDQLDPSQKRAFDAIPMKMMMQHHGMMGGSDMMGGPGMMGGSDGDDHHTSPPPPRP
jgi:hypothetical protein